MKIKFLVLIIVGIVISSYISGQSTGVLNVDALEFKELIEKNDGVVLDVRTEREYNGGFIKGAKLYNMRNPKIKEMLLALPKDKPVYLYCLSGARSRNVASFLVGSGYTKVYNLKRGIIDWNSKAYSLEKITNTPPSGPQENTVRDCNEITWYCQIL